MKTIEITQGRSTLVDDDVFENLRSTPMFYNAQTGYAYGRFKKHSNLDTLHRFIMGFPSGKEIDHKNGDRLDNRKENLREATRSQNARNMKPHSDSKYSRFKGVTKLLSNKEKPWMAQVFFEKKNICLGFFKDEISAAKAYNSFVEVNFGDFAFINNIT